MLKQNKCTKCGQLKSEKELYYYVDSSNWAITNSSTALCAKCYKERYPNDTFRDSTNFVHWALEDLKQE